ncbi:DUF2946 domain-containing protein [Janthinobacterium fluminis]|uniref:DUF2946 domain-containing protein n=1 Tax=Janthinobacterium fluminis TaxID=2987524 RepID=A0ABT5JWT1_9BURK|nr:DUF2946 domain-containing protein [Janthinobacterium fluminis]MDC8757192.1 DUF2946 domain-containing protein [Janthinobacterium fluminis]
MTKITRRFTAWIACFAILLAALAPSISHAIAADDSSSAWIEICSIAGTRFVQADSDDGQPLSPASIEQSLHFDHCPFCSAHGGAPGLPSSPMVTLPVLAGKPVLPPLYYQASRPLFVWASAQSRAPPALS